MQLRNFVHAIEIVDPVTGLAPSSLPVNGFLTPPQIAVAYGSPAADGTGVKIGIISFGGSFLQSDLNLSIQDLQTAGLISNSVSAPIINTVLMNGATGTFSSNTSTWDGEASFENTLDIYCVSTLLPRAQITIYISPNDISYMASMIQRAVSDGCHIISTSYGYDDVNPVFGDPTYEATVAQNESAYQAMDNSNVALCAASGDYGSADPNTNNLTAILPAASSYAIGIGGTKLTLNVDNSRLSETDDNRDSTIHGGYWGGGGGISTRYSAPSWQSSLFYTPITNGSYSLVNFNGVLYALYSGGTIGSPTPLTMRGVPDVSAPMNAYSMYFNGVVKGVAGTSAAAPTMAGFLGRLQQLTGVRRSSTALNTFFYANKGNFLDISSPGTNNVANANGYVGTVGWDAVTGLGAPNLAQLYTALQGGGGGGTTPTPGIHFPKYLYGIRQPSGQLYPRRSKLY
jgi:subtilase family serine protease